MRGGFGSRLKPVLQVGNSVSATWRARLDEHLGNYTIEPVKLRAANFFAASHAIYGVGHLAVLMRLLPERDPHAGLYSVFEEILDRLEDPVLAAPLVGMLREGAWLAHARHANQMAALLESKRLADGGFPLEELNARRARTIESRASFADWGPAGHRCSNPLVSLEALRVLEARRRCAAVPVPDGA